MAFPKNFLFGTANADHQTEAHVPEHEDIWDLWEKHQGLTPRGNATDFWNRYEEDIAAAASLGCKLFRFSVSWARVEPQCGTFDQAALSHYRDISACILSHGMQPMVTLHHFVWPVWLERDHGGMLGKDFPDIFARYAGKVASALGPQIAWWITFNEPSQLTFGYIKPWWQRRYYMPPGCPRGSTADAEAEAVGKLVPNLFLAHARARAAIKEQNGESAQVGVNPLVTGFPIWLQKLLDWGACHRQLGEAMFKFTTRRAIVSERPKADLVIAAISTNDDTRFEFSDPYLKTGKAILVNSDFSHSEIEALAHRDVAVLAIGNQSQNWKRDLPITSKKKVFSDYDAARTALATRQVSAVYGDPLYLLPLELKDRHRFKFLKTGLSNESYAALASHGHARLLSMVNIAIGKFRQTVAEYGDDSWLAAAEPVISESPRPVSLLEVFRKVDPKTELLFKKSGLRRILRRGKIRIGIRTDAAGLSPQATDDGLELKLAKKIATQILGDAEALEIIPVDPSDRFASLESKSSWLNWAWRFWGTTSLIANANWWYLGTSGKLAPELCPQEAVGAQDFVGLDYYWGLQTRRLHNFRLLEDAAQGRFLRAPVWPRGLFHALRRFHRWFPDQEIFIVENGCPPSAGGITRAEYMRTHIAEVENAIAEGVPVRAYNWWSITSNREWGHPFDPNTDFGLYFVDLDKDGSLKRQPTEDAERYRKIIAASEQRKEPKIRCPLIRRS